MNHLAINPNNPSPITSTAPSPAARTERTDSSPILCYDQAEQIKTYVLNIHFASRDSSAENMQDLRQQVIFFTHVDFQTLPPEADKLMKKLQDELSKPSLNPGIVFKATQEALANSSPHSSILTVRSRSASSF